MRLSPLEWLFGAAALLLLIVTVVLGIRGHLLSGKVETLTAKLGAATEANQTNQTTIAKLKAENQSWADKCQLNPDDQSAAVNDLNKTIAKLKADLAAAQGSRGVIYAKDPASRAWRDRAVPSAVADSILR